jgi:ubiquinone/menaquinone biosynthesis C-methylase UbiE
MLKMYHSHAHRGGSREFWEDNWSEVSFDEALRYCEIDPLRPLFESYAIPGTRMLEGGCGTGQYVAYFSAKGVNVIGLDFAQETLSGLRRRFRNLRLCSGDVAQLPFQDESFDVYYSGGVVEHFESGAEEALQEARRVLRREGVLLISVPYFSPVRRFLLPWRKDWRRISRAKSNDDGGNGNRFFQYAYTKSEFQNLLRAAGFRVIASQGYSVLWGLSELPFVSVLLGKWQARRKQTVRQAGDPRCQANLTNQASTSLIKRVVVSEDASMPIAGIAVCILRWASANMMMYVCLRDKQWTYGDP